MIVWPTQRKLWIGETMASKGLNEGGAPDLNVGIPADAHRFTWAGSAACQSYPLRVNMNWWTMRHTNNEQKPEEL